MPRTKQKLFFKFLLLVVLVFMPIGLIVLGRSGFMESLNPMLGNALIGLAISLGIALAVIDPFPFRNKKDASVRKIQKLDK